MSGPPDRSASPAGSPGGALLEIKQLTLRFRGLTAVNAVDLEVRAGEIVAVIGPNGAGKTSLFNAVTGIYEPTEGEVHFEGRDLRQPRTRGHLVRWGLVGLLVGLLLFLFVADVDKMWSAVVRPNFKNRASGFQFADAARDLADYLMARPRIEQKTGRFHVTTFDGKTPFGSSGSLAEALAKREAVGEMAALDDGAIQPKDAGFAIVTGDGRVLDEAPSRDVLVDRLAAAAALDAAQATAVKKRILAFLLGIGIGVAGAIAVWRQTRRTPSSVAARGLARTFQNIRLFQDMTVRENVLVGMDRHLSAQLPWHARARLVDLALPVLLVALTLGLGLALRLDVPLGLGGALLALFAFGLIGYAGWVGWLGAFSRGGVAIERDARRAADELLARVDLAEHGDDLAKNLAYGDQRRLEIARALATRPRLLLLDEPAAGMNPSETVGLMKLIQQIRDGGVTVLLIEHHMRVVMGISDRIAVLEYGSKIAEGTPEEIRTNPRVIEAYLGKEELG